MEELYELLENNCPTIDFRKEKKLITDKLIDSIELVSIITDIEETFSVEIDISEIAPENFDSVESMWEMINSLKE